MTSTLSKISIQVDGGGRPSNCKIGVLAPAGPCARSLKACGVLKRRASPLSSSLHLPFLFPFLLSPSLPPSLATLLLKRYTFHPSTSFPVFVSLFFSAAFFFFSLATSLGSFPIASLLFLRYLYLSSTSLPFPISISFFLSSAFLFLPCAPCPSVLTSPHSIPIFLIFSLFLLLSSPLFRRFVVFPSSPDSSLTRA